MKSSFWKSPSLYLILAVVLLVVLLLLRLDSSQPSLVERTIDGQDHLLLTAKTDQERARGLSGIMSLDEIAPAQGMVFYINPPQRASFWNKDTHLDLTLYWLNNGQVIGIDNLPSIDSAGLVVIDAPGITNEVIEIIK